MTMSKEQAAYEWDGPDKDEVCCTNCESFDGKWCELKDYRVMRPWAFRCNDFYKEEDDK